MQLRCGIPTASEFKRIFKPGGGRADRNRRQKYLNELLAERICGHREDTYVSRDMEIGKEREPHAVAWYEFNSGAQTQSVGLVTNDEGTIGASPDRLVGEDGLLEVKCPKLANHLAYLEDVKEVALVRAHYPQIMGQLWIIERQWIDILSYNPAPPRAEDRCTSVRVVRDEEYIRGLSEAVSEFSERLESISFARGCRPAMARAPSGGGDVQS